MTIQADLDLGTHKVVTDERVKEQNRLQRLLIRPEMGALIEIGYPKFGGGTGGYARYIAVCPPEWKYGVKIDPAKESPLPKMPTPLRWDDKAGMRVR